MNYEVVITTPRTTHVYEVTGFKVRGATLLPIYNNGMTPQDEPPMNGVLLREKKTVAALLFGKHGLIIGKRAATSRVSPGMWEVPGGKPEPGETDEQALARELREELGVEAHVEEFFGEFEVSNGYVARVYLAWTDDEPRMVEGHDEVREVLPPELPAPDTFAPGNADIIRALMRMGVAQMEANA